MNSDLLLSLLEEIANLKAEIMRLQKKTCEVCPTHFEDTFVKDRVIAFEALLYEFGDFT